MPIELIIAIPAAAPEPDRNRLGIAHSGALAALMPTLTTTSAAITPTMVLEPPANTKPTQASAQGITTCQVRSPLRSEWRAQRIIATTASTLGIAFSKPVCRLPKPYWRMISGAHSPSV
ncbi:hypothetical protein XF14_02515 [Burkholderia gladioli]|nr:hypothetical protein XF14_02515 [Burkholderia gladioli]